MKPLIAAAMLLSTTFMVSATESPFFKDLEDAYLVALGDIVKNPAAARRPFSVSIANRRGVDSMSGFTPLPDRIWKRLSQRLVEQGWDVSSYLPADQLSWKAGQVVQVQTGKNAMIYRILEVRWLGDECLRISVDRCYDGLSGMGWTVVLRRSEAGWTIAERTEGGFANKTVQRTGASRFALRPTERHRRLVPAADLMRWVRSLVA